MRPPARIDLDHHARLDPVAGSSALFLRQRLERRLVRTQRLQLLPQIAGRPAGEAGAHPAGIDRLAVFVIAKDEGAHGAWIDRGGRVAEHDEFLLLGAFGLEPIAGAAGAIRRIAQFRNDAFELQVASVLEQPGTLGLEMLAETNPAAGRGVGQNVLQQLLARQQRRAREIVAIEMQEVEGVEHEIVAARFQLLLEGAEARMALRILDHDLAVDQRLPRRQCRQRRGDGLELAGPIETSPRLELDLAAGETGLHAVAVEFDLVDPVRRIRRRVAQQRQAWRHEVRKRCRPGAGNLRAVGGRRWALAALRRLRLLRRGAHLALARARRGRRASRLAVGVPHRRGRRGRARGFLAHRLAGGDLVDIAAGDGRQRLFLENIRILRGARVFVGGLDQEPRLLPLAGPLAHPDQMPATAKLVAFQAEFEVTLLVSLVGVALRKPLPPVPYHHRSAAVLALRDRALERVVFDRVILDMDREALFSRHHAWAAGHRPALHHAVELQPQIVMQPPGRMLLNRRRRAPWRVPSCRAARG